MSEMMERMVGVMVGAIIDAGGTIDYKPQLIVTAILSAMFIPDALMLSAGGKEADGPMDPSGEGDALRIWQAMIGEILK